MVNPTKYQLKLITENRGIKNYRNMSKKTLLRTLNKSDHKFKSTPLNGLKRIGKM